MTLLYLKTSGPGSNELITSDIHQEELSKNLPVSICHTYTVPSVQPMTRKSSRGRHLTDRMGKSWREASRMHFLSLSDSSVREWSLATEQMQANTRGCNRNTTTDMFMVNTPGGVCTHITVSRWHQQLGNFPTMDAKTVKPASI